MQFFLFALVVLLSACSDATRTSNGRRSGGTNSNMNTSYSRVTMELSPTMSVGANVQAKLQAFTADGTMTEVTANANWTSSSETVATVSSTGLVTALAQGETTLAASFQSFNASVNVTVLSADDQLITLLISPDNQEITVGQTQMFTAKAIYNSGTQRDVSASATWTVGDASVLQVNSSGLVTALTEGQSSLLANYNGTQGQTNVTTTKGGSGMMSGLDPEDLTSRYANAFCDFAFRCRSTMFFALGWFQPPQGFGSDANVSVEQSDRDIEKCKADNRRSTVDFFYLMKDSVANNRVRFDASVFDSCLSLLSSQAISCSEELGDPLCHRAFTGLQADESGCQHNVECGANSYCQTTSGDCGLCKPKSQATEQCTGFDGECVNNTVCLSVTDTEKYCVRTGLGTGESCGTVGTGLCAEGLTCEPASSNRNACRGEPVRRIKEIGQPCNKDNSQCNTRNNLFCGPSTPGPVPTYLCTWGEWRQAGASISRDTDRYACAKLQCLPYEAQKYSQETTGSAGAFETVSCGCDSSNFRNIGNECPAEEPCRGLENSCQPYRLANPGANNPLGLMCHEKGDEGASCYVNTDCKLRYICGSNRICQKFTYKQCL